MRTYYEEFVNILRSEARIECNRQALEEMFKILYKADIYGVILSKDKGDAILINEILNDCYVKNIESDINFEFNTDTFSLSSTSNLDRKKSYLLYHLGQYEQAYNLIERSVYSCLKNKDYTGLFISLLNKVLILNRLKYNFNSDREHYNHIEEPKIKELYESLPRVIKNKNSAIYDLVTFNYLSRMSYEASKLLTKYQDANKTKTIFLMDNEKFKGSFVLKKPDKF